jgi:hypothetical protein
VRQKKLDAGFRLRNVLKKKSIYLSQITPHREVIDKHLEKVVILDCVFQFLYLRNKVIFWHVNFSSIVVNELDSLVYELFSSVS